VIGEKEVQEKKKRKEKKCSDDLPPRPVHCPRHTPSLPPSHSVASRKRSISLCWLLSLHPHTLSLKYPPPPRPCIRDRETKKRKIRMDFCVCVCMCEGVCANSTTQVPVSPRGSEASIHHRRSSRSPEEEGGKVRNS
jgi:hypothetical protein